ncbi:MAG TPA: hypothetical protein VN683_09135 [Acidothermaceae bacterium]|nr:hypothetical protein [Acidothermaceae bacterium]
MSTKKWARRLDDVAPDAGDVILSWLTRVVLVIAATAVVGFDGLSIAVAHVSAQDDANSAAVAAATAWVSDKGALAPTMLAAQNSAAQHNETVIPRSLTVDPDGTVHLKLERDATTLVIRHIGPLRSWATVIVKGSGKADATS